MAMAAPSTPLERRLVRVAPPPPYDAARIRAIRRVLNVSQGVFAALLNVGLTTVQAWEQGKRVPDGASLRLLEIAERNPEMILVAMTFAPRAAVKNPR
jgi:DNA-binding transcriptional regulator YiaG